MAHHHVTGPRLGSVLHPQIRAVKPNLIRSLTLEVKPAIGYTKAHLIPPTSDTLRVRHQGDFAVFYRFKLVAALIVCVWVVCFAYLRIYNTPELFVYLTYEPYRSTSQTVGKVFEAQKKAYKEYPNNPEYQETFRTTIRNLTVIGMRELARGQANFIVQFDRFSGFVVIVLSVVGGFLYFYDRHHKDPLGILK